MDTSLEEKLLIRVHQLGKTYGKHVALDNVSFQVKKGNIVGLLGPNGAGKTSLLRILTNIIKADKGEIFWKEKCMSSAMLKNIGYLPEERGLYKKMSVEAYLIYLSRLRGIPKNLGLNKINKWLEQLSLNKWRKKPIESLSKGMQQKIQFIAAIIHDPELLILDEPFSGFDPLNEKKIVEHILSLKRKGTTIILSTHRMDSIEELCDDVLFLNKGQLIYSKSVKELKNEYKSDFFVLSTKDKIAELSSFLVDQEQSTWTYHVPVGIDFLLSDSIISISREGKSMKEIFIEKTGHAFS